MRDDLYRLEGTVMIPDHKKAEFNRFILQILDVCGIRKTEQTELDGRMITVVRQPAPDGQGIVDFDYSIFEKKKRGTASYDTNTCELTAPDVGYEEFAEVNGDIVNDRFYTGWLNHILGTRFSMKKRFRLWDNVEKYALERVEDYQEPTVKEVMQFIPVGMRYAAGGVEFSDLMYITLGTESLTEDEIEPDTYPADVYGCKKALEAFIKAEQKEDAIQEIWELIKKDRHERERIGCRELSDVGRFSLILPARVIAYLTAEITKESFWEHWKEIHETVYHDEIMKEYAPQQLKKERKQLIEAPVPPFRTSKFLRQDGPFTFLIPQRS